MFSSKEDLKFSCRGENYSREMFKGIKCWSSKEYKEEILLAECKMCQRKSGFADVISHVWEAGLARGRKAHCLHTR